MKILSHPLCVLIFLLSAATSALAQAPVLSNDHVEVILAPDAQVSDKYTNGWETRMTVTQGKQRVRINWKQDQALFLFPTATMRLRTSREGDTEVLTLHFNAEVYTFKKSPREIGWVLGEKNDVYFQTRGGKISRAVGSSDYLKLLRHESWGRLNLISNAGTTDALINSSGKLETFEGAEVLDHVYLVRGFALQAGPVTVRIPLPEDPFLKALPADRYLMLQKEIELLPEPSAQKPPEKEEDPLQAAPATWDSPELRAKFNDPSEDPLSVKKERRVKHDEDPLKAKTEKDSEELLRVKDY